MAGGNANIGSSNVSGAEKDDNKSSKTNFVDAREIPEGYNPTNYSSNILVVIMISWKSLPPENA